MRRKSAESFNVQPLGAGRWRVNGYDNGKRIREIHSSLEGARGRRNELENLWLGRDGAENLRATWLKGSQHKDAESATALLPEPGELLRAAQFWISRGRALATPASVPSVRDAIAAYLAWMDGPHCHLRPRSIEGNKCILKNFLAELPEINLAELDSELIVKTISARWTTAASRHQVRIVISGALSWCMELPRRWVKFNASCGRAIKFRRPEAVEPSVFGLRDCQRLLVAARRYRGGKFLRWVVLQLFCGLRREESGRIMPDAIDLDEGQLRLRADQSKTRRTRIVLLSPVAVEWLRLCNGAPTFDPRSSPDQWKELIKMSGVRHWIRDGLRHTAISYKFRAWGSYGRTAEWAGNSEDVIKRHYQGRVTAAEASIFWNLFPNRSQRIEARAEAKVIEAFPTKTTARSA